MFRFLFILMVISFPYQLFSQSVAGGVQGTGTDLNARPGGIVQEIGFDKPPTVGSVYLNEQWTLGEINLIGRKPLSNYSFRYDIENDLFEIRVDEFTKYLQGVRVSKFTITNPTTGNGDLYINASLQDYNGTSLTGFIKKIYEGKTYSLFSKANIRKEKGQYIAALDVGDRTNKIVKKIKHYFLVENTLKEVVVTSKKKFSNQFENPSEVIGFIKSNKLNLKTSSDLNSIFEFLDRG